MPAGMEKEEKAGNEQGKPDKPRKKRTTAAGKKAPPRKKKTAKEDTTNDAPPKSPPKPKSRRDPFAVAKRKVKSSVPEIVDALVAKAKRGSCTHAKTLLEMTGAKRMFDPETEGVQGAEPWAKLVLERLAEAEGKSGAETAG